MVYLNAYIVIFTCTSLQFSMNDNLCTFEVSLAISVSGLWGSGQVTGETTEPGHGLGQSWDCVTSDSASL